MKGILISFLVLCTVHLQAQEVKWSTYFGGSNSDYILSSAIDSKKNIYGFGYTNSATGIATSGASQTVKASPINGNDAYLAKFSIDGRLLWATYFGGTDTEFAGEVSISKNNEVIIVGYTLSNNGIASIGSFQSTLGGGRDGFIAKYDENGTKLWSTYLGGAGLDEILGVTSDTITGDIFVVGRTSSTGLNTIYPNVPQQSNNGLGDGFIARLNASGQLIWLSYFGTSADDLLSGVTTDHQGKIFISGKMGANNPNLATPNAYKGFSSGSGDAIWAAIDTSAKLIYSTFYGSIGDDEFRKIKYERGSIYLAGLTSSIDSISTPGAAQEQKGGGNDALLVKFDTSGTRIWGSYVGGNGVDYIHSLSVYNDNIYFGGYTSSSIDLATSNAYQNFDSPNSVSPYFGKYLANGSRQFISYFGYQGFCYGINAFGADSFFIAGSALGLDTLVTFPDKFPSSYQLTNNGMIDGYFARFGPLISLDSTIRNNAIGSNQFLCGSQTASLIIGQTPTGGNGLYSYLWLQSTSSAIGPFSPASGLNTSQNYSPGLPTTSTWYKRVVFSGTQNSESNVVQISNGGSLKAGFTVNASIQCERDNFFTFSDTTTVPDIITRRWEFGDGNTGSNTVENYTYTFGTINYFNVKLYLESAGGCKDSMTKTVYLIPNPHPNTIIGDTSVKRLDRETYTVAANTGYQYNWWLKRGLGTINKMGNNVEVAWTKSWGTDTLYCQEQTGGGCYGDTLQLIVNISPASGEDELDIEGISIYPNPASEFIEVHGSSGLLSYTLSNMLGVALSNGNLKEGEKVNLSGLRPGYYFITIKRNNGMEKNYKILKAN